MLYAAAQASIMHMQDRLSSLLFPFVRSARGENIFLKSVIFFYTDRVPRFELSPRSSKRKQRPPPCVPPSGFTHEWKLWKKNKNWRLWLYTDIPDQSCGVQFFLKSFHLCVKPDRRRRTLLLFARPGGKLNFGFIQLVLPEQKQSRSLDLVDQIFASSS